MDREELAKKMAGGAEKLDEVSSAVAWVNGDTISVEVKMKND